MALFRVVSVDRCTSVANGQTDGRTPDDSKDRAYALASRGKN